MTRLAAWTVLRTGGAMPLRAVDRVAESRKLDQRDRALVRRIVGTELRRRATLRAIARTFARGRPSPELLLHLRIGLTQIFFLDQVPVHAAVSETVRATADTLGLPKGRYANGVLRNVLRARRQGHSGDPRCDIVGRDWHLDRPVFRDPNEHPLLWAEDALSIPAALVKRWQKRHGREPALALARAFLDEPDLSVRVVRGESAGVADELRALDLDARETDHPRVLLLGPRDVDALVHSAPFQEGRVTIQGETALRAAELLEPREGERLLDLCAAPGGKTAVLAAPGARVVAADENAARLSKLASGLERLAPEGRVTCVAGDGTRAFAPGAQFDGVLVDAPCSNTGVLGARPGARWRFGPSAQASLTALQGRLLDEAAERVHPGGRLVYSTCSLEPEENGQRVRAFLEARGDWRLEEEREALPAAPGGRGPVDGGYAARLRRG